MMDYKESEFLLLSGIQHFEFCERQWALIHIENEWEENVLTVQGNYLHEKADNPYIREKRKGVLIVRGLPVHSSTLGITGVCDVVEFHETKNGVSLQNEAGTYIPVPVEYKRGKAKRDLSDIMQLTAQAMCLEHMLMYSITKGYLYYHETRTRIKVEITDDLKDKVTTTIERMHSYFKRKHTPKVKTGKHCNNCSLRHICLPELLTKETVASYMKRKLAE